MTNKIDTQAVESFWSRFPGHINFLEESVKLGHNEEFQIRYDAVNKSAQEFHPSMRVEFSLDMMEAKVNAIVITSKERGDGRKIAMKVAKACPEKYRELVTPYRLPALPWETKVTKNWMIDMAAQFGMQSIANEVGTVLADVTVAVKTNPQNGKVLIQVGFKNKRELKAVGEEIVLVMLELLLGEEIIAEAVDLLSIKTAKELSPAKMGWEHTSGLNARDVVLRNLL
ncbi:hypothetical protein R7127_07995 [Vibrio sp. 1159]|uniref:hypothetical protein n=1 Tax=Vibrio sp. 1159 TaxID=3074545 RepID=UPI002964B5AB|nr:hypothetical protein [Vibrio sp. 1159]MDW2320220.1 hypothetical protein [Vibrio sp. 1159]